MVRCTFIQNKSFTAQRIRSFFAIYYNSFILDKNRIHIMNRRNRSNNNTSPLEQRDQLVSGTIQTSTQLITALIGTAVHAGNNIAVL